MSGFDSVPEVLWQPGPERIARARITDFATFAAARGGRDLPDYASLWSYSTTDLEGFWSAVADYFAVRWHRAPVRVLAASVMPGADWFPGGALNYAEPALAGSDTRPGSDPMGVFGAAMKAAGESRAKLAKTQRSDAGGEDAGPD